MEELTSKKPEPASRRWRRIGIGVAAGFAVLVGVCWVLILTLGDREPHYRGKPIAYWIEQMHSSDPAATNQARQCVDTIIIPQLLDRMFHDTRDSRLRARLVEAFNNNVPGVDICYTPSATRRGRAAGDLGQLGPSARAVLPDLIRALKGTDAAVRPAAARALGQLQCDPQVVIPLLIGFLDDPQEGVPEGAVAALGDFGTQSKAALPKLRELTKKRDKDLQSALRAALKQIDPQPPAQTGSR